MRSIIPLLLLVGATLPGCHSVAQDRDPAAQDPGLPTQHPGPSAGAAEPALESIEVNGIERTFLVHVPNELEPGAPVVLVFHGAGGNGARVRGFLGAPLEAAARNRGFIVAYPDGVEGNWNDCRTTTPYAARVRDVDDLAFVEALIRRLEAHHGADPDRVRALGFSNGGQMVLRLALERPELIEAAAVVGASLPLASGSRCAFGPHADAGPRSGAVPILLMNGTADPVNPFAGGMAKGLGGEPLGEVHGSRESAERFAREAGHVGPPREVPVLAADPGTRLPVERLAWIEPGHPEVSHYTVHGGGHTIPGAEGSFPARLGHTEFRLSAAEEMLRFFSRQPR